MSSLMVPCNQQPNNLKQRAKDRVGPVLFKNLKTLLEKEKLLLQFTNNLCSN